MGGGVGPKFAVVRIGRDAEIGGSNPLAPTFKKIQLHA
jgi:hypothetical protein